MRGWGLDPEKDLDKIYRLGSTGGYYKKSDAQLIRDTFSRHEAEREAAIAANPDYGEIFCRCEQVTKAEILQAIHNPLGVHTVNGVKVRTRATMGRCQGGYCETRITEALQQELGLDCRDIELGPAGSWMFTGSVKGGGEA